MEATCGPVEAADHWPKPAIFPRKPQFSEWSPEAFSTEAHLEYSADSAALSAEVLAEKLVFRLKYVYCQRPCNDGDGLARE